jgi:hypothetical protein
VPAVSPLADYDVSPDGQRFLMLKNAEPRPGEISVVLNWTAELKQKTPAEKKYWRLRIKKWGLLLGNKSPRDAFRLSAFF